MIQSSDIERFWEDGYLVVNGVLTPDEVEYYRAASESREVVSGLDKAGYRDRIVHLLEITSRHPAFRELAKHPGVVSVVTKILGDDVQLHHSKLATKPPKVGQGTFSWHQDFAYFPHTNASLVAVMVMLDDATPENGCMSVVRGSHRWGLLNHLVDGWFCGQCMEPERWSDASRIVTLTPRAGGISVHHALTLHASGENVAGLPRRGVVYQYRAADAYQLAGDVWVDTGYQIAGCQSATARCEGGAFLMPRFRGKTPSYGNVWRQVGDHAAAWNRDAGVVELSRGV
jgi:ectoine hydroxylase-related dioxygenase (phytanoyl-CoA dioxygenase family)